MTTTLTKNLPREHLTAQYQDLEKRVTAYEKIKPTLPVKRQPADLEIDRKGNPCLAVLRDILPSPLTEADKEALQQERDWVGVLTRSGAITPPKLRGFLIRLSERGLWSEACRGLGVGTRAMRRIRAECKPFADLCAECEGIAADRLEASAWRLAVEGVIEECFDREGRVITRKRRHDSTLHGKLMDGSRPEKYRPAKSADVQAGIGAVVIQFNLSGLGGSGVQPSITVTPEQEQSATFPQPNQPTPSKGQ